MDRKQADEDAASDDDGVGDDDVDRATETLDPILDKDRIKELQQQDPKLKYIYGYLAEGNLPGDGKEARETLYQSPHFSLTDGILFRHYTQKHHNGSKQYFLQIAIPASYVRRVLELNHDEFVCCLFVGV